MLCKQGRSMGLGRGGEERAGGGGVMTEVVRAAGEGP